MCNFACRHFGEPPPACAAACDCCACGNAAAVQRRNVTAAAQGACAALAALPTAEKRATLAQLLKAWRSKAGRHDLLVSLHNTRPVCIYMSSVHAIGSGSKSLTVANDPRRWRLRACSMWLLPGLCIVT